MMSLKATAAFNFVRFKNKTKVSNLQTIPTIATTKAYVKN